MQDRLDRTTDMGVRGPGTEPDRIAVVGLFDAFEDASRTVDDMVAAGFDRDAISLVASNATREYDRYVEHRHDERYDEVVDADTMGPGEGAAAGGGIGAAIGGIGGVLMGLGLLAVPGVGPALAAGPIVSGLIGAGIGGAAGGIMGALVNAGIPEERAHGYAEGVRRGGTVVTVNVPPEEAARAEDIMVRHGVVDIDERITAWRDEGWSGFDPKAQPYDVRAIEREREVRASTVTGGRRR